MKEKSHGLSKTPTVHHNKNDVATEEKCHNSKETPVVGLTQCRRHIVALTRRGELGTACGVSEFFRENFSLGVSSLENKSHSARANTKSIDKLGLRKVLSEEIAYYASCVLAHDRSVPTKKWTHNSTRTHGLAIGFVRMVAQNAYTYRRSFNSATVDPQ